MRKRFKKSYCPTISKKINTAYMLKIFAFVQDRDTFLNIFFKSAVISMDKANIDRFKSHFDSNEPSQLQVLIFKLKRFNKYKRTVHVCL